MTDADVNAIHLALTGACLTLAEATSSHTTVVFWISRPGRPQSLLFLRRVAYIELDVTMQCRGVRRASEEQARMVVERAPWFAKFGREDMKASWMLPEQSTLVLDCAEGERVVWLRNADIISPATRKDLERNFMRPDEEAFWPGGPSLADVLGPDGSGMR